MFLLTQIVSMLTMLVKHVARPSVWIASGPDELGADMSPATLSHREPHRERGRVRGRT
jgi:hypothetical protein